MCASVKPPVAHNNRKKKKNMEASHIRLRVHRVGLEFHSMEACDARRIWTLESESRSSEIVHDRGDKVSNQEASLS